MDQFPQLHINQSAIIHNLKQIKKRVGSDVKVMGVVKANAYGLGALPIADLLTKNEINYLAVARRCEADELKTLNLPVPILIFEPLIDCSDLDPAFSYTISDIDILKQLVKVGSEIQIQLKVNTGMNRIGMSVNDLISALDLIGKNPNLLLNGIYTHLASSDDLENPHCLAQLEVFKQLYKELKPRYPDCLFHAANSAAIFNYQESHFDMVRSGIALYGTYPNLNLTIDWEIKPVVELKTRVVQVKPIEAGDTVGYSAAYRSKKESRIATIQIGYADGYKRILSNSAQVLINGALYPLVGNVSMDLVTVDIGSAKIRLGDEVILIESGRNSTVALEKIAEKSATIPYEIISSFSRRVQRIYR
ncbi:MAG: alanine racemase [Calditrichaeota bacterium]|nr:alanine racemase [Calditrichota bacterium]